MTPLMDTAAYSQQQSVFCCDADFRLGIECFIRLVLELKRRGIKTAVASVSKNTRTVLQGTGIEDLFDVIVDGYSVKNTKPAPDIFLFAAKELGVKPEDCAVVEDAEAGIEAALAGNMLSIGIGPEERAGKARYRFEKIGDVTPTKLLEIINF